MHYKNDFKVKATHEARLPAAVRENEPALIPRKSGWTHAISFVGLSQSCYRLQILSHQNRMYLSWVM